MVHGETWQLSSELKHVEVGGRLVAHEGFDVQVDGDVFGRGDRDGRRPRGYLRVNHMALTLVVRKQLKVKILLEEEKGGRHLKDALSKDEDCLDDCVIGGGEGDLHVRLGSQMFSRCYCYFYCYCYCYCYC